MKKTIVLIMVLMLLSGCSHTKVRRVSETNIPPIKLAILPLDNYTNDVNGAQILRDVIYSVLLEAGKGYEIQSKDETDKLLNEYGITSGGQLKLADTLELCTVLGVDGLLFAKLNELEFKTMPFYFSREVDLDFSLYNMGLLVVDSSAIIVNRYLDINGMIDFIEDPQKGAERALTGIAIAQGVRFATAGIADHELKPEMYLVAEKVKYRLPNSNQDKIYLENVEMQLSKLKNKFDNGERITLEKKEAKYEEIQVVEDGITLF